jgi:putative Holliday junction resolvase
MSHPGRVMALDIGTVRTGIAVSDELRLTTRALEVVSTDQLTSRLSELIAEFAPVVLVAGRPRSLDGSLGEQVRAVEAVVDGLRGAISLPIEYEDETGTTPPSGDDAAAARAILEGYLSEHST